MYPKNLYNVLLKKNCKRKIKILNIQNKLFWTDLVRNKICLPKNIHQDLAKEIKTIICNQPTVLCLYFDVESTAASAAPTTSTTTTL